MTPQPSRALFPEAFEFLFQPARYKVAYGGRGGGKSQNFARALLIQGAQRKLRILCCRETQKSITDSVHRLLGDQIVSLGLAGCYEVQKSTILGANGTEFIFAGLRHNIDNLKSTERIDIAWVEEAHSLSQASWAILIPTVRADNSEIWVSFNPSLETDPTYKRFVIQPPPGAAVRKINYTENPFFPEVLRIEMEHLRRTDPKAYAHVWLGECQSAITGAVYANEIAAAEASGRICAVPYDRTRPVHTFWDLGYGDTNCIWFAQTVEGWYNVIDYLSGEGRTIAEYLIDLQQRQYLYGADWLPHDGVDMMIHGRLAGDRTRSIEQLMRAAGRNVRIAPKMHVVTGINASRTIFPQCRFDAEKCADGLMGLRHYQWGEPAASGLERREPLHNWASHPADAFRTMAVSIKEPEIETPRAPRPPRPHAGYAPFG